MVNVVDFYWGGLCCV